MNDPLFWGTSLSDVLRNTDSQLRDLVLGLDADMVLSTPAEDLVERIVEKFAIECPVLHKDKQHSPGAEDVQIDVTGDYRRAAFGAGPHYVRGTRFRLRIPFSGDRSVFSLQPSTFSMNPPYAYIDGQELVVTAEMPADSLDAGAMKSELDGTLSRIETLLERSTVDIDAFNGSLAPKARELLEARRKKVLGDRSLEEHLAVPVKRRSDSAPVLAVDVPKKRKGVTSKPTASGAFKPEPAITNADFEAIVEVISSFAQAAERFPTTFSPMPEEVLRELLLVVLNNQFGPAVGEPFSRVGKTDIAILHRDGPVFIGECKIWRGEKAFAEAADQLLGYLVWRDTKAAVVLFIRNQDVPAVVGKATTVLESHSRYKRRSSGASGHGVFVLHHDGDDAREIDVALITVPIPAPASPA